MITAQALTKKFGTTTAVDNLTFTISPGQVTGFLGPNGAGKTTTMRMLLGLDTPTSGTALIQNVPYRDLPNPLRTVGALLDAKWVHPNRSARSHLRWLAASNNIPQTRVAEVLGLVGLTEVATKPAGGFSLGMSQRLGLAAALLGDPPILLFDEPLNGLDPEGIHWMRGFMRALAGEGRTVLVSSHLLSEMEHTAERLIVIGLGALIADTTTQDFIEHASESTVRVRSPHRDKLRDLLTRTWTVREEADALLVTGATPEAIGELAAANSITLYELAPQRASLEEAFMRMTGGAVRYQTAGFPAVMGGAL
ncbi:ATP-binding cassette domain-containing protein [Nocardia sp. alder85J]|uniref:ATP-binding cassette domain-containing protein n=1 Tax=Nocardia sp. alder85J TaxID=2862949 RepID=UPI001CD521A6|nr:ATP-binding cassette domain-containing protein [Nocardia sp. alder85J]MCX4098958.1 ATP-binding cassette domain-containing protein [Nocardia sp. alder85J]